jgi:hypothetical protein
VTSRRSAAFDATLYALSALLALWIARFDSIPIHREWGRLAAGPYAAGAVVAALMAARRAGIRARTWLALGVVVGCALLPLSLELAWRARTEPGRHAHSEVIVTEEAAKALLDGGQPYAATYLDGPLAARPLGTRTHFPYLPGMLAFGIPRAVAGDAAPLADARVAFALGTLVITIVALRLWRAPPKDRLLVVQLMAALPTGALLMTTGGDDLPVLSFLFMAVVLLDRKAPGWSGAVAGAAAALKQTAWIALPFLVLPARDKSDRPARVRFGLAALCVVIPLVFPFVIWEPSDFVEDVILFPLGLGQQPSAAGGTTLGSLLIRAFPGARDALTMMLMALVLAVAITLLVVRSPAKPHQALWRAGIVMTVALVLAPAARLGYAVYPIELFTLAWLLSSRETSERTGSPG